MQASKQTTTPRGTPRHPPSGQAGPGKASTERSFNLEALAPCLADLKRQIALRQAMP